MTMTRSIRAFVAACLIFSVTALPAAAAGMYSWVDANGVKHYSDQPPPPKARDAKRLKLPGSSDAAAKPAEEETETESEGRAMARAAGYEDQDIKRNCELANQNLVILTAATPHPEGSDDAKKRDRAIERAQAQVKLFCH